MILDHPTVASEQLRALNELLPGTDSLTSAAHHGHLHNSCDSSSSDSDTGTGHRVLGSETLGLVQAVRMFGGVIIGTAAEELSRKWRNPPQGASGSGDACSCGDDSGNESDRGEPLVASFSLPRPPPLRRGGEASFKEVQSGGNEDEAACTRRETGGGSMPSKRPGGLNKRKLGELACSPRGGSFVSECALPTEKGLFRLRAYRYQTELKSHEPVVMVAGDLRGRSSVTVRVHDQCQTSEVFGSKRCDCREQLDLSLRYIQQNGGGAVIYLAQEGRGIGLANKVAAYALQDGGLDTVDANRRLGFKDDERSYECVDFILKDMGIKSIQLMTNNPLKIECLRAAGVKVDGRIPIQVPANDHNHAYLEAKAARMGHLINNL